MDSLSANCHLFKQGSVVVYEEGCWQGAVLGTRLHGGLQVAILRWWQQLAVATCKRSLFIGMIIYTKL